MVVDGGLRLGLAAVVPRFLFVFARLATCTSPQRRPFTAQQFHDSRASRIRANRIHSRMDLRAQPCDILRRFTSAVHRSPPSQLAVFQARKPALRLGRSEQAPITFPAIRILKIPTRTIRRCRATHQRQARCRAKQIRLSHGPLCRRTAHGARRDLDSAEIADAIQALGIQDSLRCICEEPCGTFAKQRFQQSDHVGAPLVDSCNNRCVVTRAMCPSIFFPRATQILRGYHRSQQCHNLTVIGDMHL